MTRRRQVALAAALVAAALLAFFAYVIVAPDALIRMEFARQRHDATLSRETREVAGHRWVYAYREAKTPDAPTIVMVHGFVGGKENFYPLARALAGKYRLVIPDLPGWGESQRVPNENYGFLAQSERLAAFIRNVSPGEPVVLVGHSMGGGIAALVAAGHPELVSRVALIDAAGVRFDDNVFGADVIAGRNPYAVNDRASLDRFLATVFHVEDAKPWLPWPADKAYIARRTRDAAFEQQVLGAIGRGPERFLPGNEAARIQQPTLLLWCRQDTVIDPSALALYAARIPQAKGVLLDDCGHMSIMERPEDVAIAIDQLIERGLPR
ncbi:alpha/beta fold hydrolase [Noviluteimonas gilva]|uniref:Alpha/beta fold hydrolase n=1 Tax=Noviluteimonas gilva TaxID=2682097 RepID=A0A7C9LHV3_9GAMM|nr:alpha/beta hydrolase [Lysobacter gilvus]MUV13439.1 alpha/beta fold hydrolase [Lysobacter gilvus]